jgi:hypothetical protein
MARLSGWLEALVILLTFWACVTALALVALKLLGKGWGVPLPLRRFLPLAWVLAFTIAGWLRPPGVYWALSAALACFGAEQLVRFGLVPLGWVRATYVLSRLAGHTGFPPDPRLRPLLLAARALERRPTFAAQRFVERKLGECGELGPLGAAAAAVLAHSRGDAAGAQGVLRGVACVTDAEQNALLWPVLRDLLYQDSSEPPPQPDDDPSRGLEPGLAELVLLARRLPGRARAADVARAVQALELLLASGDLERELTARALELGAVQAAVAAHAGLLDQAESDLAEAMLEEHWPAAWLGSGRAADAVRKRVREQRLALVERLAAELQRRAKSERDLPEPDEWQAWGELSRAVLELEQDATTLADHQLLFRAVHRPIWDHGYRQGFVLGRRSLGSIVFLRQRRLAYAAEASEAYKTIENNLRASRARASPSKQETSAIWYCDPRLVDAWRRPHQNLMRASRVLITLGCLAAFVGFGPGDGSLLIALSLSVMQLRELREPILVQVLRHEGRFAVQTQRLRWRVAPGELELKPIFGRFSRVRLARAPWWLPSLLLTVHASAAAAERDRQALLVASPTPGSRASG